MIPKNNIRLQYLRRFSLSKDGRIFEGDRELNWYMLDKDVVCALTPSNGKHPVAYKLQDLYLKSWGARPHMSVVNRIRKALSPQEELPTTFFLNDGIGTRTVLPLNYTLTLLDTTPKKLYQAIKNKERIGGFEVKGK